MKLTLVKRAILLLHEDGRPHYPFSHYLNKFTNPNTIDLIGQALRIFSAHEIEPVVRAMEGRCLSYDGQTPHRLVLPEIESLSDRKIVSIASAKRRSARGWQRPLLGEKTHDFYAYVLRPSSASLFVERKGTDKQALVTMKSRYGWTVNGVAPNKMSGLKQRSRGPQCP